MPRNNSRKIAVVGGGAAGLIAAGTALEEGAEVTLYEHNTRVGRKLYITGKGRCNLTNDCSPDEFLTNVVTNPRFLYSAIYSFPPHKTMELFERLGVRLKVERGRRVFPVSDRAVDIVDALSRYTNKANLIHAHVENIKKSNDEKWQVTAGTHVAFYDAVIIAGGGKSYPLTGSDGSCYAIAESLGHTVSPLLPSLVPIEAYNAYVCAAMQGLSLKNVVLTVKHKNGKVFFSEMGEMLFTHFGISGPLVLSASSHMHKYPVSDFFAQIDLKPALDEKTLDTRIRSDLEKYSNKNFENAIADLLPSKMIPVVVAMCGVDKVKKANAVTKEERRRLVTILKSFEIPLRAFRPISEAIVTSGGVNVNEINPKTMESKRASGIYFAGEIIDVDAYTGGYNLQIAFSTGYLAGKNAAKTNHEEKTI